MKKQFILAALTLVLSAIGAKAMGPYFVVSKVEILCSRANLRDNRKIVHVISNAGWSVHKLTGLKIMDAGGATIATYTAIPGDFYAPPLALVSGQSYTIIFLNSNGTAINPDPPHHSNPYIRVAPDCGIEKLELGPAPVIKKNVF